MDDDEEEDVFADKIIGLTYCECIFLDSKEEFLLATTRNEDINQRDPNSGDTPLLASIKQGRKELIPMVLDLSPDPNLPNNSGDSPLHWACLKGYDNIVTRLLKIGADKDAKGEFGNTPLHLAASGSHVECVNIMLMVKVYAGMTRKCSRENDFLFLTCEGQEGASTKLLNEFGNNSLQMASNIDIKKRIKSFMENPEIAKKSLMAEEVSKKRKREEDVEIALAIQQELERKRMEEEAIIKAKRDAVAAEELRIEQEEAAIEAARLAEEERLEQERLEAERLIAEEKKVAKKGSKKKKKKKAKKKKKKKTPSAEPVAEPIAEPVVEPVAEPIAEAVAEPIAEQKETST